MGLGRHQLRLLKFAMRYQGWQSYGTDRSTVDAVHALSGMGLVEINDHRQFRLDQPNELRVEAVSDA